MGPKPKIYYSDEEKRKALSSQKKLVGKLPKAGIKKTDKKPNQKNGTKIPGPKSTNTSTSNNGAAASGASIVVALETARAIAKNKSHRKHTEVSELLRTFDKGWIEPQKFIDILQGLIF